MHLLSLPFTFTVPGYSGGTSTGVKRNPSYLQMTKAAASKRVMRLDLASYPPAPHLSVLQLQLQLTWPQLSCMYCMGKVPGWFFGLEISDLFA